MKLMVLVMALIASCFAGQKADLSSRCARFLTNQTYEYRDSISTRSYFVDQSLIAVRVASEGKNAFRLALARFGKVTDRADLAVMSKHLRNKGLTLIELREGGSRESAKEELSLMAQSGAIDFYVPVLWSENAAAGFVNCATGAIRVEVPDAKASLAEEFFVNPEWDTRLTVLNRKSRGDTTIFSLLAKNVFDLAGYDIRYDLEAALGAKLAMKPDVFMNFARIETLEE